MSFAERQENLFAEHQEWDKLPELGQGAIRGGCPDCSALYQVVAARNRAIRPIAPSTLAWFLDMLNRYRGPEDRKESLVEVFDPSIFTVNHPAWETHPGTAIDLPALTSEIATRAEKGSEMAEVARDEVREFREHSDTYDDAELMELGAIAIAGLADPGRTFRDREDVIRYLALNASAKMEDLWAMDDTAWTNTPSRHVEFPDMVERRKQQLLAGKGTPRMREKD